MNIQVSGANSKHLGYCSIQKFVIILFIWSIKAKSWHNSIYRLLVIARNRISKKLTVNTICVTIHESAINLGESNGNSQKTQ